MTPPAAIAKSPVFQKTGARAEKNLIPTPNGGIIKMRKDNSGKKPTIIDEF